MDTCHNQLSSPLLLGAQVGTPEGGVEKRTSTSTRQRQLLCPECARKGQSCAAINGGCSGVVAVSHTGVSVAPWACPPASLPIYRSKYVLLSLHGLLLQTSTPLPLPSQVLGALATAVAGRAVGSSVPVPTRAGEGVTNRSRC